MRYLAALALAGLFGFQQVEPAKIDVPPILEEYGTLGTSFCDMGSCTWVEFDNNRTMFGESMKPHRRTRETCADKTRFLMTSEDGKKHCIKLDGGK